VTSTAISFREVPSTSPRPRYLLLGPEGAVEWLWTLGPDAYFHYFANVDHDDQGPRECYLDGVKECWPDAGTLQGKRRSIYLDGDAEKIEEAMREDYEVLARPVRAHREQCS
jgi:hypothetical protein